LVLAEGEAPQAVLRKKARPELQAGGAGCSLLGQLAWLGDVKKATGRDREVRLSRAAIAKGLGEGMP
jgi:hypothetical protein